MKYASLLVYSLVCCVYGSWAQSTSLSIGDQLTQSNQLVSPNGEFYLTIKPDGNLAIFRKSNNEIMDETKVINGTANSTLKMQTDGNFVLSDASGSPKWASGTYDPNNQGNGVVLTNNGKLQITNSKGEIIWTFKEFPVLKKANALFPGERLRSRNGKFFLLHEKWKISIYSVENTSKPLWTAGNWEHRATDWRLVLQTDGNLVLNGYYNANWTANLAGKKMDKAILENDGRLVGYDAIGHIIWATSYRVGEKALGGFIARLPNASQQGLVCAERDLGAKMSVEGGRDSCNKLSLNSYTDWRLPNFWFDLVTIYESLFSKGLVTMKENYYFTEEMDPNMPSSKRFGIYFGKPKYTLGSLLMITPYEIRPVRYFNW